MEMYKCCMRVRLWQTGKYLRKGPSFRMVADEICPSDILADSGKEVVSTWRLVRIIML